MTSSEQLEWAKNELSTIMEGSNKTRYKALVADPTQLEKIEAALLLVAKEKLDSYQISSNDSILSSFNWVTSKPELSYAILMLQQNLISISEVPLFRE